MKFIIKTFFLFSFIAVGVLSAKAEKQYKCVGYLPNWDYSAYQNIDYEVLTHLNIAFCNPNTNGDLSAGLNDNTLKAIIQKAHDNGVMVLASLGGAGYSDNYPALVAPGKRSDFCDKIVNYALKFGFDGIDLDVEGEAAASLWHGTYEAWVAELRERCNEKGLLLTTAVGQWYADKITNKTFTYFDFVTIMEYDLKAHNYQSRINYFLNTKGVPKEKLILGLPFYGYRNGTYSSYKDILKDNPDAWYTNNINGCTYHNMQDVADIARLSKNYDGVMIWELSQDATGKYSLLKAIKDELHGNGFSMPEVEKPVTDIRISNQTIEVLTRRSVSISAEVIPSDATIQSVIWKSNNENVAKVDQNGVIRGIKPGTASITASSLNGGKTATCQVTVVQDPNATSPFPDIYYIVSAYSNKGVDVIDKNSNSGAGIQQWAVENNNNDNQRWIIEETGSEDIYYIKSKFSNLYLTAMGTSNGSKIEQHPFTGNDQQKWKINEVATEVFSIINVSANRALDVSGPSQDNGTIIHIWEFFNGSNQQWIFQTAEIRTGIKTPIAETPEIRIYPNPTNDILYFDNLSGDSTYKLFSISGNLLETGMLNISENRIQTDHLQTGMYVIEVKNSKNIFYNKLIKK